MTSTLLIPVENQVRELDAKLLLAYVAARRGFSCIIGPKREMEARIASFPKGIFLLKSLRIGGRGILPISRKLGHVLVGWDEEALVHPPPEVYFSRRLAPETMEYVSHLFAWGPDNADLWRQYPELPSGIPIHVTGNPRTDLLRPEMRCFYETHAAKIRETHGDFILVNTNFNHVNAFYPGQNLFQPAKGAGEEAGLGQAAKGMPREYAEGLREHKQAILEAFLRLVPALDRAFPDHSIVVRPHPSENHEIYRRIAARCQHVRVSNEGNVVPWLMSARALVHNGCTTAIEAYVMGVPTISYRAKVNEVYDDGFYRLPNRLSHECFSFEELQEILRSILGGELGAADGGEREGLASRHLAARVGPLACERIVDVLKEIASDPSQWPEPTFRDELTGWSRATSRGLKKRFRTYLPGSLRSREFLRHRYPGISREDVRERLTHLREALGVEDKLSAERISREIFRIKA